VSLTQKYFGNWQIWPQCQPQSKPKKIQTKTCGKQESFVQQPLTPKKLMALTDRANLCAFCLRNSWTFVPTVSCIVTHTLSLSCSLNPPSYSHILSTCQTIYCAIPVQAGLMPTHHIMIYSCPPGLSCRLRFVFLSFPFISFPFHFFFFFWFSKI